MADTDLTISRDDLLTEVLELLGVLAEGESPNTAQTTSLQRTLNSLIDHWQSEGINIYAVRETFLFLKDGIGTYNQLDYNGTTGLDVDRNHIYVSAYEMADFTDIASGATTVEVNEAFVSGDPIDSATTGDVVGIPLEDGTVHWAEISSVGTSGSFSKSFTFASHSLPGDADNSKKMVVGVSYPGRPIAIMSASLRQYFDDRERPIEVMSIRDWNDLNTKATTGEVNQIFYNRETTTGDLRVWPIQGDDNHCLVLWAQVPLDDIESDASLNTNVGFPQEYNLALTYNLAKAALPKYGVPATTRNLILQMARQYKDEAFSFDSEKSMYIQPDYKSR